MGIRSLLSKPVASLLASEQKKWSSRPFLTQDKQFRYLVNKARNTVFGKDHGFSEIRTYDNFKKQVPVRDYENLSEYIGRIKQGEKDVLWPGKPAYFAKTSGTTSGTKYIPITHESIPNHINSARNAILSYIHETGNSGFLDGKLIFLSGSPVLEETGGIKTGRLSGIVNHHVPSYLRSNQMPSFETNCMEDWENKVDRIVEETLTENMTLISGIPPWVQMYFDRIIQKTGKPVKDVFPNFSVFVYGGVNFDPYRARLFESIGKKVDSIATYPASEGFIAYQDRQEDDSLLLLLNSGIYFEFIPTDEYFTDSPRRLSIREVETGVNYALIINSNAGLWGYSIGDTIKFVSLNPHRIVVTGRIKHFISAFGEHVIMEEVENALKHALTQFSGVEVTEFTVAPMVTPAEGLPHHEWYIEFSKTPSNIHEFESVIDKKLQELNSYYFDLVSGSILKPLKIYPLKKDAFRDLMKSQGKLGGQNKVPRLANDRKLAEMLRIFVL